ncbi:MAG TPA: hypothetical protein PK263_01280 [bacterium]|nr:hypothetical protein [bacterium]
MSKTLLAIIGVVLVLMGIAALIPSWTMADVPAWHAWVEIVVGVVAVYVASTDKKEA